MASVYFEVVHPFETPARIVWDELVDWKGHEAWIPATRVEVGAGDPTTPGTQFTAFTGFGPVALQDRMVVTECEWDDESGSGRCEVEKLGPVLRGRAWFTVEPVRTGDGDGNGSGDGSGSGSGAVVKWFEDVSVPYVPQFVAPVLNRGGAAGFRLGMKKLARQLATRS